ncbi:MAG: helix-turn-helix domain-containing protein [Lachnospiraceae bacterium]|nr:helix-turn-helix domain-containing protein [Lachnospiraceae bacterium]MDE6621596.1 helix-turn-helix domain-containing protein [Lachnospiraceae bacterium]MDE7274346.1 helix-turn-helix domain-containing protein [Lachnospiraceae bacterium]
MDYYLIGQKIRKVRKSRGLSQEELAERIGISTTHMSHIETGNTKLSLPVFVDIASALEVRTDELLLDDSPAERIAAVAAISNILEECNTKEIRIMEDLIKALKTILDHHL